MKIVLTSIGTRGDIEPFLAIGKILKEEGHKVICAFTEQYREVTEKYDLEFTSLGEKYDEVFESDAGKTIMGGGTGIKKLFAFLKFALKNKDLNQEKESKLFELVEKENPDRLVYHSKNIYPLIWEYKNRGKTIFISPFPYLHYVKGHPLLGFHKNYGDFFNKFTFKLYDFGVVKTTLMVKKWLKINDEIKRSELKKIIQSRKFIYTISPALFPRPDYWKNNVRVLGHQELKNEADWKPDKELTDYIEKHKKILFVTFGSMLNPDPLQKTKIILDILERNKIPAIINTAYGGLIKPDNYNSDLIHFASEIPYDWVFPKMYAVIHHGGAGTTHLAIKHGCASMIIPHFMDQFLWNNILGELGIGPKGIKINKINDKNLEPKILELLNNKSYKERTEITAGEMKKENFNDELLKALLE